MEKSEWQIQVEHNISKFMENLIFKITCNKVNATYDMGLNVCSIESGSGINSFNCSNFVYDFIENICDLISAKMGE